MNACRDSISRAKVIESNGSNVKVEYETVHGLLDNLPWQCWFAVNPASEAALIEACADRASWIDKQVQISELDIRSLGVKFGHRKEQQQNDH
jgi:hypothetical protein